MSDADTPLTADEEAKFRETVAFIGNDADTNGDWWSNHTAIRLLATLAAARSSPAPAGLDVERLALAIDHVRGGFDPSVDMDYELEPRSVEDARRFAAEYARLAPPSPADPEEGPVLAAVRWFANRGREMTEPPPASPADPAPREPA